MATVEFNYNGSITLILCPENESMEEICKKFATKIQANINNLIFLYSGIKINLKSTLYQIMNNIDKERKIVSIVVNQIYTNTKSQMISSLVKSDIPICPECSETIKFDVINYNISLSECKNKHTKNLLINEYEKTQYLDYNKIICMNCQTNKKKVYNNKMYMCYNCKNILCPLCKNNHDKKHIIVNYDFKNFMCERHYETYNSYCNFCRVNLCLRCQKYHQDQYIVSFGSIFPEKDELLNILSESRKSIDVFKKDIENIIYKLNKVKENVEILYKIYYEMITKFDDRKRNYEAFMSLNSIKTNMVFQNILQINQITDINSKFQSMMNIYELMSQYYNNNPGMGIVMQANQMGPGQNAMGFETTHYTQGNQMGIGQNPMISPATSMINNNLNNKNYIGCKPQQVYQNTQYGNANSTINQPNYNTQAIPMGNLQNF